MAKSEYQSLKVLWICETLRLESDENHKLSTNEIIALIEKKYGVKLDRKAIYGGIETVNGFYNKYYGENYIEFKKGNPNHYYCDRRELNAHEIKFLLDAVQSATFLPKGETAELSKKIADLAGLRRADVLMRDTVCLDKGKHTNYEVYDILDNINRAIETKKQASFKYFNLGLQCKREYRNGGERYVVNPLGTVFVNGYYYLACYIDGKNRLSSFRVDRMSDFEVGMKKIVPAPCAENFTDAAFKERLTVFGMWNGDTESVTLHTLKKHLGDIYDKFGEDIHVVDMGDGNIKVTVLVNLSPVFYGWVASYADEMRIAYPLSVKNKFVECLNKSLALYKD